VKRAKLYGIPASNAVLTAQLALERKGIDYERRDLLPVLHRITMRMLGFSGSTVPGIVLDGRRVHGSLAIIDALDELQPDPPLYPSDPEGRRHAEDAVRWGEQVWQLTLRRLLPWALLQDTRPLHSLFEDARMRLPGDVVARVARPGVWVNSKLNSSNDTMVRSELAALPGRLDHVDRLIADGVLDASEPGAPDIVIATTTRALMCFEDLRPLIEGRPAADHARTVVPRYPGEIPAVFPASSIPLARLRRPGARG
jgi:glutathione S-transferase